MKKYWVYFKTCYQSRLEYRGDMVIYSLSSSFTPMLGLALWLATSNSGNLPFSNTELIAYFIAVIYMGIASEMWQSWLVAENVNDGSFSTYLLKPFHPILRYVIDNFSDKIYKMSMVTITLLIVYFIIPQAVWAQFHLTVISVFSSIIALVFGYIIMFLIEYSIGLSAVWFYDIGFLKNWMDLFYTIFAGRFVPLIFFPAILLNFAIFLPFRYTVSFPVEIILGKLSSSQIMLGFMIEAFWVGAIFLIYKLIYKKFAQDFQGHGS